MARQNKVTSLSRKQVVWTIAGMMLGMFIGTLDQTVVGTAMPRIITDLNGFRYYIWVTNIYIIVEATTILIIGKLTDMYGRKKFYLAGLVIFTLSSLGCGLGKTMAQIIILRGIQGIGGGIMLVNAFTVIGDLFSPVDRGKYQGYINLAFGVATAIGPTIGGVLTDLLSWRWVFFMNIPLCLLVLFILVRYFPEIRSNDSKHSLDYRGLVAIVLTLVPLMMAITLGGSEYPWLSVQIIGIFVFVLLMLTLFIYLESRAREPIISLSLFKNRIVTFSNIVLFFFGIGMFAAIVFIPLFYQGVLGTSATSSGNLLIPMMVGIVLGSVISGQLLSRAGGHYKIQGSVGLSFLAAGMFLLSTMTVNTSYATVATYSAIAGLGAGVVMPVYTIAVQNAVPHHMLGEATSVNTFFRPLGAAVGLAILGTILNSVFMADFLSRLPDKVKTVIPFERLVSMAHDPRALVSSGAQLQLQNMLGQSEISEQILDALRHALASSISRIFFTAFIFVIVALIFNFFLKEIPLKRQSYDDLVS